MGGVVPLGYRVEERALHIVEDHAEIVRSIFRRYLETESVVRLKQRLDAEGFRLPVRINGGGRSTGGGLFSRGHVYKLLSNPTETTGFPFERKDWCRRQARRKCANDLPAPSVSTDPGLVLVRGRIVRTSRMRGRVGS